MPSLRTVNKAAFSTATEEALYWIGFLFADGCIQGNRFTVQVAMRDIGHIEKFKAFLKSDHKITITKPSGFATKPNGRLSIGCKEITDDLRKFGLTENKTFTADPSEVACESRHFWRGVVDGDGSFGIWGIKRPRVTLSLAGSLYIIEEFSLFCSNIAPTFHGFPYRVGKIWATTMNGPIAQAVILELYRDCTIALERKAKRASQIAQ